MVGPTTDLETSRARPSGRWERFGAYPAAGAVVAVFGGSLLVVGTLYPRPSVAAALGLILLAVFVAYCMARPHDGPLLAALVLGGGLLVAALAGTSLGLALTAALALFGVSFVVAGRLDERDDERHGRRRHGS